MTDPVIIVRPSEGYRQSILPISTPAVAEASRAALTLKDDEIAAIILAIESHMGFLSYPALVELVSGVIKVDRSGDIASFVWNVNRSWRASDRTLLEFLDEVQSFLREEKPKSLLTSEERVALAERLPRFVTEAKSLQLQFHAEELIGATGFPLEEARLLCDARPLFSEDRSTIEGMVILTTLKLQTTGTDGLPNVVEIRLSPGQLRELVKTVTDGEAKLKTMGAFMREKGIHFPAIESAETDGAKS